MSTADLRTDLVCASVVVGMGSTALVEALLAGRPVVQIVRENEPRYLNLDPGFGAIETTLSDFGSATVEAAERETVDSNHAAAPLGLRQAVVTFRVLFSVS